jgi:hypothetical protein
VQCVSSLQELMQTVESTTDGHFPGFAPATQEVGVAAVAPVIGVVGLAEGNGRR